MFENAMMQLMALMAQAKKGKGDAANAVAVKRQDVMAGGA